MRYNKKTLKAFIRRKLIDWKLLKIGPQDIADEVFIQKVKNYNEQRNKKINDLNKKIEKSIEESIEQLKNLTK